MNPVYKKQPPVKSFFDPKNPTKIHPGLLRFSRNVAKIAVLDFGQEELRDHYEKDFYEARITYVYLGKEIVAFFIAVFSKDKNGDFYGNGFPGIKYKYRKVDKADRKINFKKIMTKLTWNYVYCYYNEILAPEKINPIVSITKSVSDLFKKSTDFDKILGTANNIINRGQKLIQNKRLIIKATAENPIMYATLMATNLDYWGPTDPKPPSADLKTIAPWSTEKLIAESYKQFLNTKNQHPCLHNPPFVVNMPAKEWRKFFLEVEGKTDAKSLYIKYFLWQNFNFPDTAFLFYFKVNIKNIFNVLGKMYA